MATARDVRSRHEPAPLSARRYAAGGTYTAAARRVLARLEQGDRDLHPLVGRAAAVHARSVPATLLEIERKARASYLPGKG